MIFTVNNTIKFVLKNKKEFRKLHMCNMSMWPHFKSNGLNCVHNSIIKYLVSYIFN